MNTILDPQVERQARLGGTKPDLEIGSENLSHHQGGRDHSPAKVAKHSYFTMDICFVKNCELVIDLFFAENKTIIKRVLFCLICRSNALRIVASVPQRLSSIGKA